MPNDGAIASLSLPEPRLTALAEEARAEGYDFIDRLISNWTMASNRFDRPGERLAGVWIAERLVAVGGLNRDPYAADDRVGRLRHVYVRQAWRHRGIGRRLTTALIAGPHGFDRIRLRTANAAAARMYRHIGFDITTDADATHVLHCLRHF